MSTGAIVLARLDSRRLPGKVVADIAGRPLLSHVIDRVRRATELDSVVVATSDRPLDDPIAELAQELGVEVFRGPAEDVAGRCLACAERYALSRFVRVCADSPFVDPALIDQLVRRHSEEDLDVVTNTFPRSFPPGTSVEVVTIAALRRVTEATTDLEDLEHVTRYFYTHPDEFRIANHAAPNDRYVGVKLAVDTATDLERTRWVVDRCSEPIAEVSLDHLAALTREWLRLSGSQPTRLEERT